MTGIAKISRPCVGEVVRRERLFELLETLSEKPVVWISAPAGGGKTTLAGSWSETRKLPGLWYQVDESDADVASFFYHIGLAARSAAPRFRKPLPLFSPAYIHGIPAFTKLYFGELYSRLRKAHRLSGKRVLIVLDNFQEVPSNSGFHEMLAGGLDVVPEGITFLILSRSEPPSQFVRMIAEKRLASLRWDDIRFTFEETGLFVDMRLNVMARDNETIRRLHERTGGWAAGLVLIANSLEGRRQGVSAMPVCLPDGDALPQNVFDYFAAEIFENIDQGLSRFLMKTALLPRPDVKTAVSLTGVAGAEEIFSALSRYHFFTERRSDDGSAYAYHPLFRDFLLCKARTEFSDEELRLIQAKAATLLEDSGSVEDAAALLCAAGEWEGLIRMILSHAGRLVTQGRSLTLQEWICKIPEVILQNTPWLIYWLGVCRMTFDPVEGRRSFETAYGLFKKQKDPSGLYLSWSGIVDTFVYEQSDFVLLDRWLTEFEQLQRNYPEITGPDIYARVASSAFCALIYRRPGHPDIQVWEERVRKLVLGSEVASYKIMTGGHLAIYYSWWRGETAKSNLLLNALQPVVGSGEVAPLSRIIWRTNEAICYWMTGQNQKCISAVDDGLGMAASSGVHIWDFILCGQGAFSSISMGDIGAARKYLDRMAFVLNSSRFFHISLYHYLEGWIAFCESNLTLATEHFSESVRLSMEAGVPFAQGFSRSAMAAILAETGEYRGALSHLAKAKSIAADTDNKPVEHQCLWIETEILLAQRKEAAALDALRRHLAIGREYNIRNHTLWRDSTMAHLYSKALEAGIETDHVKDLISLHKLSPDMAGEYSEVWPYPLRIYTLGRFRIERDGEPIVFAGRIQQKTLAMLKALTVFAGASAGRDGISDILWPDSDGYMSRQTLRVTLHRLRRRFGDVVLLREDRVELDLQRCWVDSIAVEQIIKNMSLLLARNAAVETIERLSGKMFSLYEGMFLKGDSDEMSPWAISYREALHSRFLGCVRVLGRFLEKKGLWRKAVYCYLSGLETDDLVEEFHQRLMICYLRMGCRAEALKAYERCRETLTAVIGIEPSPETNDIFRSLKGDAGKPRSG